MRGRGLLIAAATLQLVGAAIFLLVGGTMLAEGFRATPHGHVLAVAGAFGATAALGYIAVSIALLGARRWGWIGSLALDGLSALSFLSLPILGHVGVGELLVLAPLVGVPLFVTIGLLVGGRHAVFTPSAKTAAEPTTLIPPNGA